MIAYFAVSEARGTALKALGQQLPSAFKALALLDTGASCTCVDPMVVTSLGLTPTGSVSVNTPSTGSTPHQADQYDVALVVPKNATERPLVMTTLPVIKSDLLAQQGFHALIGRDVLSRCTLFYNGDEQAFTLSY